MLTKGEIFFKSSFDQFTQKICSFHDGNKIVFYIFPFLHGTYFVESKIVVKSYIALRSFVFLFNSLIFYQFDIYHYYHSCLASEFLPDLIGEYKEFFTELFHSVFSYFVVPFFNTLGGTIT